MAGVEAVADALGVPLWCLVPIAMVAAFTMLFILDALSFVVLKPWKSPPVIACIPLVGGMAEFLKGPMGLMAKSMPKYGEVFTGESLRSIGRKTQSASACSRDAARDQSSERGDIP